MKFLLPLIAILAVAFAGHVYSNQPVEHSATSGELHPSALEEQRGEHSAHSAAHRAARILSFTAESDSHGYQYSYDTENGIKVQEVGHDFGKDVQAEGAYSYVGPDGREYRVTYTAGQGGFVPQGAHLPTAPPVPEAILKALEQNARDEAAGIYDDGHYQSPEYSSVGYEQGHHYERGAPAAPPAPPTHPAHPAPVYIAQHHY